MLVAGVPALIMCLVFEKFGGLRVPEQAEVDGLDITTWGVSNFADDLESADAGPAGTGAARPSDGVPV
jgi:ammonia channel protein AmtB